MADRTVSHFVVQPALLTDICKALEQVPGTTVRRIMNRIENLDGNNECVAAFVSDNDLGGHKKKTKKKSPSKKKSSKKRKKVAPKRGGK